MKYIFILMAILFLTTPAHTGALEESAESYYARHMKSCQHKERTKPWHIIAALAPTITDECCARSVEAARERGGTFIDLDNLARAAGQPTAKDEACPQGKTKRSLNCPTSKHWCE